MEGGVSQAPFLTRQTETSSKAVKFILPHAGQADKLRAHSSLCQCICRCHHSHLVCCFVELHANSAARGCPSVPLANSIPFSPYVQQVIYYLHPNTDVTVKVSSRVPPHSVNAA